MEVSCRLRCAGRVGNFVLVLMVVVSFFRGAGPGCNSEEVSEKLTELKNELRQLEEHEEMLDMHTQWVKQSIKNVQCDSLNRRYAYIKYEDLKEIFQEEFILAVQAPSDTQLNVPTIESVCD